ncbi:methyltransferase domain-containing protein [Agromyces fucosus]|uniref:methyltransferase domain-containing protein n=1 Tax=Agromyces fucosus TaxID=41985 RepID=UPI0014047A27|nr:methyltransferase domain-containing protein [Agromyces fucosus]
MTLLPPRAPRTIGDDRQMLEARAELLESGAYAPIAEALVAAMQAWRAGDASGAGLSQLDSSRDDASTATRIADLGCGTGYYADALRHAAPGASILLADRSPAAVRMAMRAVSGSTGVVLDLWRPLPIRDDTADIALNVFAPRNPPEYARIVRPRGMLLVVVPTSVHFEELRRLGAALDIPEGKAESVSAQLSEVGFAKAGSTRVEYPLVADAETRELLVDMGPAAHHRTDGERSAASDALSVTVSVDVVTFVRSPAVQ